MIPTLNTIQEPPQGLDISPRLVDWFSIVIPEYTRNLIHNPKMAYNTNGYSASVGASLSRSSEKQRRGAYSLKAVYTNGYISHDVYVAAGTYTLSFDIWAPATYYDMTITIEDSAANIVGAYTYNGRSYWDRESFSFIAGTLDTYTIKIYGVGATVYIDGIQLENRSYATTYCDGDMVGNSVYSKSYWWLGEPNASPSERSISCRTGGRIVNFYELGLRTLAVVGVGIAGIVNSIIPTTRGGVYLQSSQQERSFTIVADRMLSGVAVGMRERLYIERYMRPDIVMPDQPLLLKFQYYDPCDRKFGEELDILCVYESGLEGQITAVQERIGMTYRVYLPWVASNGSFGSELGYNTVLGTEAPATISILEQDLDGVWSILSTDSGYSYVLDMIELGNYIYICGQFADWEGIADTQGIVRFDKVSRTFGAVPGGGADSNVIKMSVSKDGYLYVIGDFTSIGGVAISEAAKMSPAGVWEELGTGGSPAAYQTNVIYVAPDGKTYVGGHSTSTYSYVWELQSDNTWAKYAYPGGGESNGFNGTIRTILKMIDGTLYVAGTFMLDSTLTYHYNNAVQHSSTTGGWESLGGGMDDAAESVYQLLLATDGNIYAAGIFEDAGGVDGTECIARWNGYAWEAMGSGISATGISGIVEDSNGKLYVYGKGLVANNVTETALDILVWTGSGWIPYDIEKGDNAGTVAVASIVFASNRPYIGYNANMYTVYVAEYNEVNYSGDITDVVATIVGPGRLQTIKSVTTGEVLGFDFTINANEIITITTGTLGLRMVSSTRGDMTHEILPGSSGTLRMLNGINKFLVLITGGTSDTEVTIAADIRLQSFGGAF